MRWFYNIAIKNRTHLRLLAFTVLAMLLLVVANTLEIFAIGFITNKGQDNRGGFLDRAAELIHSFLPLNENFTLLAFFLLIVSLFKASALFFQRFLAKTTAIKISRDLRLKFFQHIQKLPMSFYHDSNIGSLSSRVIGDAVQIADAINATIVNYIQTPVTVISSLVICFLTSWQLSLLIFLGFPLLMIPIVMLARKVKKISRDILKNQEKFSSVLVDFIGGIQTIKVFAMESFSLKKYEELNDQMAFLERKSAKYDLLSRPIVHTIAMVFLVSALVFGLYVLEMNVAEVLFFCGMLYLFYEPIKKFAEENSRIQRGVSAAERLEEVMKISPEIHRRTGKIFTSFKHEIAFENVWFKYQDDWVLKNVNFTIKRGELVALVGPTGSGKSTIAQLLPRLWDYQQGEIYIDSESLKSFDQTSLRENIAFVPQKPFLFLDTIKENIKFGLPYSDEAVFRAAASAHAAEFIEKFPEGYDRLLSEGGKNLSGGQQQRLAIARALIKNSPLLIMDEATSSLDAQSEFLIKETIQSLKGHVTQIVIAHRLSTIENADKILYVENGEIVSQGTQKELLQICPRFKRSYDLLTMRA